MKRLATTLCGVVLSLSLAAQKPADKALPIKPVTENYRDFSDWRTIDPAVSDRFNQMHKYPLPQDQEFRDEVASALFYLDAVKVPDWEAILPRRDTNSSFKNPLLFSGDSSVHLPNRFVDDAAYFYFLNDSHALFANDTADIKTVMDYHLQLRERGHWSGLSPYDTTLRFTVEARADKNPFKGYDDATSDRMNYVLSGLRGLSVAGVMNMFYPGADIEIRAFGNAKPLNEDDEGDTPLGLAEERVVRVIPGKTAIECGLEQVTADFTVGDCSYSMAKENGAHYSPLEVVMLYPYENGNVFLFSNRGSVRRQGRKAYNHVNEDDSPVLLTNYVPAANAQTPLNEVLLYLALVADPGTSFRFITDGHPSPSRVRYEHVVSVAQRRDISFSFIGTGPFTAHFNTLKKIADETGGQTYFACDPKQAQQLPRKAEEPTERFGDP
ncbi:VWA domain-containing protein [Candidatus Woesearchaeota archaeon]|nr:VWA domain-containing protein [Candidatus Woesearchaeota archaeon]